MKFREALRTTTAVCLCIVSWSQPAASQVAPDASGRARFALSYHGNVIPWRQFLLRATPGESVSITIKAPAEAVGAPEGLDHVSPAGFYDLRASGGSVRRLAAKTWSWDAPGSPGLYRIVVEWTGEDRSVVDDSIVLTAAVLVPPRESINGHIRGYRVGAYPDEVFRGLSRYKKPRGYIRVRAADVNVPVSPHFRLGQFSVRRPEEWPKFTVLHERMLLKMELLVERGGERGIATSAWRVLSAFRSPWYNATIGRPRFSRHIFGDAADLYVDADRDGRMDDLNRDGRVNVDDAKVVYDLVEAMDADADLKHLLGGLGRYGSTPNHGPFIHLDTRGYRARW